MSRRWILGGTTEGRLLAEFCGARGIEAFVSVATEYGGELVEPSASGTITQFCGRPDDVYRFLYRSGRNRNR